jgi:2-succinyl-6-hydroxy-2,4-cyclohexadiene-1-carboxylate synthase
MSAAPLAVRTAGDASRAPLCLLHGFMGSGNDWRPLMASLAGRAHLVAPDLPGHGQSTGRPGAEYRMDGAVAAVLRTLDTLGIEQCTLLGYSMGGRIALALTVAHPNRVQHLVLESASPGLADPAERLARREHDARRAARITDDLRGFLEDWYRMPLFASLERHGLVEEMVERRTANDPHELARAIQGLSPGAQPPLWDALDTLVVPTLLLAGALDEKYVALTQRMAARSDAIRRVVVPNAGHTIHAEQPGAVRRPLLHVLPN